MSPITLFQWTENSNGTETNVCAFNGKTLLPQSITRLLRYQPPLKSAIFQNVRFCVVRIKLFKSVLLKKVHNFFVFLCKVTGHKSFFHVNYINYPLTSPVILD